jgi:hypothetical protein
MGIASVFFAARRYTRIFNAKQSAQYEGGTAHEIPGRLLGYTKLGFSYFVLRLGWCCLKRDKFFSCSSRSNGINPSIANTRVWYFTAESKSPVSAYAAARVDMQGHCFQSVRSQPPILRCFRWNSICIL